MTKADYEVTAKAINEVLWKAETDLPTVTNLTVMLVNAYRERNPRFDGAKFIEKALASNTVLQGGES